jgi:hypothetical protein
MLTYHIFSYLCISQKEWWYSSQNLLRKVFFCFSCFCCVGAHALSMTFAVTTDGGKRLYSGVPDSRDFYVSLSEDDGTAPGAYSTTNHSSDDDTARCDSSSRETCAYLAPLRLPDFYAAKGLNCPIDIDDEESSTSAFSSVVGSDEEDCSDEDDILFRLMQHLIQWWIYNDLILMEC